MKQTIQQLKGWGSITVWHRIIGALIGMTMFVLLGYFVPELYYRYAPAENFYNIEPNPLTVDKVEYEQCDFVIRKGTRTSSISTDSLISRDLVLFKDEVDKPVHTLGIVQIPIESGVDEMEIPYQIPCEDDIELETGVYFIRGITVFEVHGHKKVYEWETEKFNIL